MWGILKIRLTVNPPLSKTCQITPRPAVKITPGPSAPKWHPKVVQKVALPDRPCQTGCCWVLLLLMLLLGAVALAVAVAFAFAVAVAVTDIRLTSLIRPIRLYKPL